MDKTIIYSNKQFTTIVCNTYQKCNKKKIYKNMYENRK